MILFNNFILSHSILGQFFLFILSILLLILMAYFVFFMISKKNKNKDFTKEMFRVQDEERQRIYRDLHDTVAQDLRYSLLLMSQLEDASISVENKTKIMEQLKDNQKRNLEMVRSICYNLTPSQISANSITSSLQLLCESMQKKSGFKINFLILEGTDFSSFSQEDLNNIYRIIEEALNNSIKHSGGSEISLFTRMSEDKTKITAFITDNGKGISEERLNILNSKNYKPFKKNGNIHFGIQNMKQRAQLLNANLLFSSIEGDGAEILLEIPTGGSND